MKVRVSRTVREPVKRSCCGTYAAVPYDICVRWPFTRMSPAAQSDDGVRPARVSRSVVLPAPPPHVCTSRVCMHAPRTCAPRACACMHPARVHLSHVHACTSRVYTSRAERQQVQSHERARACGWTASRCGCWSSGGTVAGGGGSHRTSPKHRGVAADNQLPIAEASAANRSLHRSERDRGLGVGSLGLGTTRDRSVHMSTRQ